MRARALALVAAGMAFSAAAAPRDPIVLRVDNRSGAANAVKDLWSELQPLLEKKGYDPVAESQAKDAAVLTVTISVYLPPKARTRGPKAGGAAGVSAVLAKPDGQVAWRNSVATIGQEETISYTRLKRADPVKALVSGVAEKLLWTLPRSRSAGPEQAAVAAVPVEEMPPVVSTRYDAAPWRARAIGSVARFPLRKDRDRR